MGGVGGAGPTGGLGLGLGGGGGGAGLSLSRSTNGMNGGGTSLGGRDLNTQVRRGWGWMDGWGEMVAYRCACRTALGGPQLCRLSHVVASRTRAADGYAGHLD